METPQLNKPFHLASVDMVTLGLSCGSPFRLSIKPLAACLVSLAAVIPIVLSRRHPNLREGWTFLAGFAKAIIVISMLPAVLSGRVLEWTIWEIIPGLPLQFRVDAF